jgi:hypothetical protein
MDRVSKGMGQCNFSGQRDRSSFIVMGQRDNGTSSKSCHGTGRAETVSKSGTGCGTGQSLFSVKIWDGTQNETRRSLFLSYNFLFSNIFSFFRTSFSCYRTSFSCFRTSFSCFLVSFGKVILSRDPVPWKP